ncbi:MAG: MMPL family transporter [Planctomycetaceae bacterium]|nr:MMPL family transporter [Planctomycetaceae bacterium]MDG2389613.1 MMPL family transporter [Planctomycetaceae bacterium]
MSTPNRFTNRLITAIFRARNLLFGVACILLIGSIVVSTDLEFDQSIESLYSQDDPQLQKFLESKQLFGGDEFLMVAWRQPDLFMDEDRFELTENSKQDIESVVDQLNELPGVNAPSTQSLVSALKFPFGRARVLNMVEGVLIDSQHQITSVVVRLTPEKSPDLRAKTFEQIVEIAENHEPPAYVAGEPIHIHDMFRYVEEDGTILFRFSFALLGIVLLVLFRSLRWLLLPALIVGLSVNMTEAILVLADVKLSMVSAIMNSLVTIIGVATMMHLAVHYRDHRSTQSPEESLRESLSELVRPIFWTCATTSIGFLALMSSQITPVRSFGMMMSIASMLVFFSVLLIIPAGILLVSRFQNDPQSAPAEEQLVNLLDVNSHLVGRFPWIILTGFTAATIFAAFGFQQLEVETNFAKNFRSESRLVKALTFVESVLGGSTTLEVNFPAPEKLTNNFLKKASRLTAQLRELGDEEGPYFTTTNSLNDGIQLVPTVPFISNTPRKKLNRIVAIQPEFESTLYNAEEGRMRIFMRTLEQQSAERKNRIIEETTKLAKESFPEAKVAGLFVLLTFLIDSLMSDQLISFAWAAAGIYLLMSIAFRSPLLGFVGLIPNIFPIILVIGGMGWVGFKINIGTAMITCVSMGLTVDSSIHFVSAFQRERKRGLPVSQALSVTSHNVGRALVFANLALVVGFSVLTFSQFIPLVYFGVLVSLAMIGGLAGNLILLPMLLQLIYRESKVADESSLNNAASSTP